MNIIQEDINPKTWRAFHTKARHEKAIAERLQEQGLEVYCPVIETKVKWSDRHKKIKKPLFNGYIFAKVTEQERIEVLQDPSVTQSVLYLGKPGMIRDEEIEAIKFILDETQDVEMKPLQPGTKVKVSSGLLKGALGEVISFSGTKARVRIASLQLELIATVNAGKLEKLLS